ncbi:MAG: HAD-IB family hydrolase [Acidimicrobiales bacterium]|nr:HAD-IB family hydrolase [Acidimicrobiales bacterium]
MGAAVFDLDRTLLPGVSGPVLGEALAVVGLRRSVPGERLAFRLYDHFGENYPSMVLARLAPRATKGWRVADVRAAAELAAPRLLAAVQPHARVLLESHRRAGDLVVIATTTPRDLLEPFAEALGVDALLATTYRVVDGCYDGTLETDMVWGRHKLAAVRAWCAANGVDRADVTAYSDSWYDLPLLSAVGHPVPVNPDLRLRAVAAARRWPVRWLDAPPGVVRLGGFELQDLLAPLLPKDLLPFMNLTLDGVDHLPASGPAIVAANHRSYLDPLVIGLALEARGRTGRFLAKAELFAHPLVAPVMNAVGAIPVERGSGSDAPLDAAADALAAGEVVVILPQGTIPRGPAFFDPQLRGRPGAVRLAAMSGAPLVPLGLWGTERVWPRNSRAPRVLPRGRRPEVSATIGAPVTVEGSDAQASTAQLMSAIEDLLPDEARVERSPSAEELAATYPSGVIPEE